MVNVCTHGKTLKMPKPSKTRVNIVKSELLQFAYLVNLGSFGTQVEPLEPYEASGELSWGALGAIGRRLGSQKETKSASRVLKDAKWRPFRMHGKTKQKQPFELVGRVS